MNIPPWVRIDELTARTWSRLWSRGSDTPETEAPDPQAPWPWAKMYAAHVPSALRYPQMSLGQLVDQAAARYGHLDAVCFDRARMTYDELKAAVDRFAAGLHQLGVSAGDRVAIALPNCPEYVIAFFAVLKLGGVVVQAGPLLGAEELRILSDKTSPKVVIALDLLGDRLGPVAESSFVQHVVIVSLSPHLSRTEQLGYWFKRRGKQCPTENGEARKLKTYAQIMAEAPAYPPTAEVHRSRTRRSCNPRAAPPADSRPPCSRTRTCWPTPRSSARGATCSRPRKPCSPCCRCSTRTR